MTHKISPVVAILVVAACLAILLVVYHFTVGAKVSRPTGPPPVAPPPSEPGAVVPGPGSHAQPGPTGTPVTKPATEKKPTPPGG